MTKVTSSDLASANSNNMNGLEAVMECSIKSISALNTFIYESTDQLKGGGYDAVRKKMTLYVKVIQA